MKSRFELKRFANLWIKMWSNRVIVRPFYEHISIKDKLSAIKNGECSRPCDFQAVPLPPPGDPARLANSTDGRMPAHDMPDLLCRESDNERAAPALAPPLLLNNAQVLGPSLSLPAITMRSFAYHCQNLNQQVPRSWQDGSTELTCCGPVGWAGPVGPEPRISSPDNRRLSYRQTFAQEWIRSIGQWWCLHNFVFISIFI